MLLSKSFILVQDADVIIFVKITDITSEEGREKEEQQNLSVEKPKTRTYSLHGYLQNQMNVELVSEILFI